MLLCDQRVAGHAAPGRNIGPRAGVARGELQELPRVHCLHAQAKLEHDGNVGQVIDVAGSFRPLGVEAARIDAHGPVKARPAERRRPRWVVRAAVGGSVAAAAALAMVVGNTLEVRRNAEKAAAAPSEEYAIRVGPSAPASVDAALRDAEAKRAEAPAETPKAEAPAAPSPPPGLREKETPAQFRVAKRKAAAPLAGRGEGSGGDAPAKLSKDVAKPQSARMDDPQGNLEPVPTREADRIASSPGASASGASAAVESAPPAAVAAPAMAASGYESSAQQARHAGNYLLAADLYRRAADARRQEKDLGSAAWNLAHAVECLSAAGRFDDARQVRDELGRTYPSEATALSAARRALREVEPAQPAAR